MKNKHVYLHERAIAFAEMIEENKKYRVNSIFELNNFKNANWDMPIRFMNTEFDLKKRINTRERLEIKLISSYIDILSRIVKLKFHSPKMTFENAEGAESEEELAYA